MVNSSKRRLLLCLAAAPLLALPSPSLYLRATDLIQRLRRNGQRSLVNPVSRLQREFRLGYGNACFLAARLARDGQWTLAVDKDGVRHAHL